MWVIFKGSLGHNSMVHWCSIPVEQGDAGSNIFDISGRLLDLPHTVPQHKCSYEFVTQIIKISKHFIIENITKQELLYICVYIYIYVCACVLQMYRSQIMCMLATKGYYPMGPWDDTIGVLFEAEIETMTGVPTRRYHPQTFVKLISWPTGMKIMTYLQLLYLSIY